MAGPVSSAEMAQMLGRVGEIDRAACRAAAEDRFSVSRMVDDHIVLYRRLLRDKARRGRVPVLRPGPAPVKESQTA